MSTLKEAAPGQGRMLTNSGLNNTESKLYLEETLLLIKPQTPKSLSLRGPQGKLLDTTTLGSPSAT